MNPRNRSGGGGLQSQLPMPFTPAVKALVIANVSVWVVLQLILERYFLPEPYVTEYLALTPLSLVSDFFAWQPLTYMFLHSENPFHILFNMLMLWWLGSELEARWGTRFFLAFYFVSGIGAALIYSFGLLLASLVFSMSPMMLTAPVLGASGAVFGLLLAYGIIFGDRIVLFFGLVPMRARYMMMILCGLELFSLLNNGGRSSVANLAHLGGLISGFLFLQLYTRFKQSRWRKQSGSRGGRGLRLVVNNDLKKDEKDGPRYWN